jgi:WD40 repeat protein
MKTLGDSKENYIVPAIERHIPAPHNLAEYPDSSLSNRRPPYFKEGPIDISTRYDTRIFDACGEFVCTSGHCTRIWDLRNGEQILSLSHGESVKILSVSFKPAANPEDEGDRLWLGNNFGELLEIKTISQNPIVATNNSAHTRREIIRIYRYRHELWTLDDSGTLHLWAQDSSGLLTLDGPSLSFRVPKGHTFSLIVGDKLWHAAGSDIRVFMPTLDTSVQFQVLQRPLSHPGVGDVTSGAVISNQPDRVYFGHADGKVSIYSRHSYSCLGIVNVSIYKINSLAGVGSYLWAAYNTGMIYVYDTTQAPWLVKKDWRAHENPVINILANNCSFWKLERLQVVSLGADNVLRLWDGLLQDDWLGNYSKSLQSASIY